jgi:hypothetical protein
MPRNDIPDKVRFRLPRSNKDVYLITWDHVVSKLTEFLEPVTDIITSENASLTSINHRVDEWLEEQQQD